MKQLRFLLLFTCAQALAQPLQLDMDVFLERRREFMSQMESSAVAIFPSKPVYLRNLDVEYDYRQESNFYYLTGFDEPESVLLLSPSHPKYKYVLYVRERNPGREAYEGRRTSAEDAIRVFKADTAVYYPTFKETLYSFAGFGRTLYYTFGINPRLDDMMRELVTESRAGANWPIIDPTPILAEMRVIKNRGDFAMGLQKAIDISVQAHLQAIKTVEPGMYENEVQAVFEYVFRKNGSSRNGYPCIVGSGPNSCILHYDANRRRMESGDVVLMDCAAEYGYYSADITRTVPVNGRFSTEQRSVYEIVLQAQNTAMQLVRPGTKMSVLSQAIDSVLGDGLVRLGLLKQKKHFRLFTLHGYSHWIGLEVHDVGNYSVKGTSRVLEPGMVFTIEPGIYIRPEVFEALRERGYTEEEITALRPTIDRYMNIGVRIEDDIVVTKNGYDNLSDSVPREINEIEALMKK